MLVRVANAATSHAEETLLSWLRQCNGPAHPRGVATVAASLYYGNRLHQFDAIIWMPSNCVVIQTQELPENLRGALDVPRTGAWRVGGQVIALGEPQPLERCYDDTHAMQSWLAERGLGQRVVHGVVLVMPPARDRLQVRQLWSDADCAVLPGQRPDELVGYLLGQAGSGRAEWTANDLAIAFRGLALLPYLPAPQELSAEGFGGPVNAKLWRGGPQQALAEAFQQTQLIAAQEDPATGARWTEPWYSPWQLYPPHSEHAHPSHTLLRITLALGIFVAGAWALWFAVSILLTYIA